VKTHPIWFYKRKKSQVDEKWKYFETHHVFFIVDPEFVLTWRRTWWICVPPKSTICKQ
jgi:hypothetical protein